MATLAEVARRAGVSAATASRVINGHPKPVADELRARVLRAVEELHYVPNAHARLLAKSERIAVGVIVHDVSDPYFAEITNGLQRVAAGCGRLLIICSSHCDPDRELAYVDLLRAQQVAAIVLAGSGYHDAAFTRELGAKLRAYEEAGGRVAVIGRHQHDCDSVQPDNELGGYLAGAELLRLGHRRIGGIAGPKVLTTTTDRLAGFRRATREAGAALPTKQLAYTGFDRDGGATAAAALLSATPSLTAMLALNDAMAVGALATARSLGFAVPGRLSIVGFDDMPIARDVQPPLTTVRLDMAELGAKAMELALGPPADAPRVERLPAELVRRASTGHAPPARRR